MTYNIETEQDLVKALKECRDGDILNSYQGSYFESHIIDRRIHLVGDWYVGYRDYEGVDKHLPFLTITNSAVIEASFYGDMVEEPDYWMVDGLQTAIRADGASYLDIRRSFFTGFNYMAVHLFDCTFSNITATEVNDCATPKEKYGFGYGIWQGGRGNAYNQVLNVMGCLFQNNRHCIAGSKHPNHIYVSGCDFHGGKFAQHLLDRHGDGGYGGGNYFIVGNRFHAEDRFAYDLAIPHSSADSYFQPEILIEGNTFARPFGKNGRIGGVMESEQIATFKNNTYKS